MVINPNHSPPVIEGMELVCHVPDEYGTLVKMEVIDDRIVVATYLYGSVIILPGQEPQFVPLTPHGRAAGKLN
jgi:hypothetical protein